MKRARTRKGEDLDALWDFIRAETRPKADKAFRKFAKQHKKVAFTLRKLRGK